ncbi:MAG: hypothetical protein AB1345_04285 [Chloroflexota bacterium]
MKRKIFLWLLFIILAVSLVACISRPTPTPRPISSPQEGETGETSGEGGGQPATLNQVPEDIPLPEGYYSLQVMRNGTQIFFKVDGIIEDVLTFYQGALPEAGWTVMGPPDNAVGAIATMYRENEKGEKISLNMQYNQLANFVSVNIAVQRVK